MKQTSKEVSLWCLYRVVLFDVLMFEILYSGEFYDCSAAFPKISLFKVHVLIRH